jgi:hypothetical protein
VRQTTDTLTVSRAECLDVVAKLEEVADAMRAVERESKDIWSEGESVDTSGTSSTPR